MKIMLVGGAVRDWCDFTGIQTKTQAETHMIWSDGPGFRAANIHDLDWVVSAGAYEDMKQHLQDEGFKFHTGSPEHGTIRMGVPKGHWMLNRFGVSDADFAMARQDGPSTDGRHPDFVIPGTFEEDRARRDFSVNAMAMDFETGKFYDDHDGLLDLSNRQLKFVGDPMERIREDGLRVIRAFRFMVTKNLHPSETTHRALRSELAAEMLAKPAVKVERIYDELRKMFAHDTVASLNLLASLPDNHKLALIRGDLWLTPTLADR